MGDVIDSASVAEVKNLLSEWRGTSKDRAAIVAAKYAVPPTALEVAQIIMDYGLPDDIADILIALPTRQAVLDCAAEIKTPPKEVIINAGEIN
jgi:hypothetical protein